ncbi:MAG: hypothetical protein DSY89_04125 [Deltaproteobacteria bacterium]|nr:MAG: hypothetical protein DSY89_04125 [Deltaproteobacteria bacterium]
MDNIAPQWQRMQFKKNKVWMMVDDRKKPIVKNGKVLIKYNLKQDYEYWVHEKSVTQIDPAQLQKKSAPKKPSRRLKKTADEKVSIHEEASRQDAVIIFTDGASSGNPGPSGIGVVLRHGERMKEISKSIGHATNNIAELEAIRVALATLKQTHLPVRIFTDSTYAQGVLAFGWKARKNIELIQSIKDMIRRFDDIKLIKVAGHSGIADNERADILAVSGIKKNDPGYPRKVCQTARRHKKPRIP